MCAFLEQKTHIHRFREASDKRHSFPDKIRPACKKTGFILHEAADEEVSDGTG